MPNLKEIKTTTEIATQRNMPSKSASSNAAFQRRPREARLLTLPEAAKYLACSVVTIRRLIWKNELSAVRWDRRLRVDLRDLDEFVERNKDRIES